MAARNSERPVTSPTTLRPRLRWVRWALPALLSLAMAAPPARAQLDSDPSLDPIPDFTVPDPERAIALRVRFDSPTEMVLEQAFLARSRARGAAGNPPLILIELKDESGVVLAQQHEWHPLIELEWDESENESGYRRTTGKATFVVPHLEEVTEVVITDLELELELLTVDVSGIGEALAALDVDGNGSMEALTDGLLFVRWSLGFTDTVLTGGAVGPGCTRCTGAEIDAYLTDLGPYLDIDGDGAVAALSDGLIALRHLFGFSGSTLTSGAVAGGCRRCTPEAIALQLSALD